jgi:hypothetical protein
MSHLRHDVWVGTYFDGLQLIRERLVQVYTTRDGLRGNDIRSVVATREGTVLSGGPAGLDELRGGQWIRRGNVLLVVKKGLNNALKHPGATEITVDLRIELNVLVLRLSDNGRIELVSSTERSDAAPHIAKSVGDLAPPPLRC